jgi:hypothetical protein
MLLFTPSISEVLYLKKISRAGMRFFWWRPPAPEIL